jgi:hypothetical protein
MELDVGKNFGNPGIEEIGKTSSETFLGGGLGYFGLSIPGNITLFRIVAETHT